MGGSTIVPKKHVVYRLLNVIKEAHRPFEKTVSSEKLNYWIENHVLFSIDDDRVPTQQAEEILDTNIGE